MCALLNVENQVGSRSDATEPFWVLQRTFQWRVIEITIISYTLENKGFNRGFS